MSFRRICCLQFYCPAKPDHYTPQAPQVTILSTFNPSSDLIMATYAIGDIQGCFSDFRKLLDKIKFDSAHDRLWLVGDLVNRGRQSLETLRFVKHLGDSAITVLGNHDLHLIMVAEGYSKKKPDDTLDAVLTARDRDELLTWLRRQCLLFVEDGYVMVHAGLLPQWDIDQALLLASEVEQALSGEDYRDFLANLYGSQPNYWSEDLQGYDRLRVVVNAMTRLRFCTPEGVMDFQQKGGLDNALPGYLPWFDVPGRRTSDNTVITGHWSALGFLQKSNLLALDSGCVWGRCLTAICLEDRSVYQLNCGEKAVPKSGQ